MRRSCSHGIAWLLTMHRFIACAPVGEAMILERGCSRRRREPTLERSDALQTWCRALLLLGNTVYVPEVVATEPPAALTRGSTNVKDKITQVFRGARPNYELVRKVSHTLRRRGWPPHSTLLATSLCSDEVNRALEEDLERVYGTSYFRLGGLAGFPAAGVTGLLALSSHVPEDGACLLVYGPHVGIDRSGRVGSIPRRGRRLDSACCGSAKAAVQDILQSRTAVRSLSAVPWDPLEVQQQQVVSQLRPHADRIRLSPEPMAEAALCLFEAQSQVLDQLWKRLETPSVPFAFLGGIEINTPSEESDYFLPLRFEIMGSGIEGNAINLLGEIG